MKLLCSLFLLFFAVTLSAQQVPKLRIDPTHAYGGTVSEYFDSVEYIPLETTKESLFGDIYNLIITDSSYIITDIDTKSVLFFDYNGKYIRKIHSNASVVPIASFNEPNKYVQIYFMKESDYLNANNGTHTVHRYTILGIPIDTLNIDFSKIAPFKQIPLEKDYTFKPNNCRINQNSFAKDSTIYLINIYKGNNLYKRLMPCNQKKDFGFCYFSGSLYPNISDYIVINNTTYAATPVENIIYKITKDTAFPIFEIVFPKKTAIEKDLLKIKNKHILDSIKSIARPPGIIYGINKIFFKGSKLFFKGDAPVYLSNISASSPQVYNFIYDTITHKTSAFERITTDEKSHFLPIFDSRDGLMMHGIVYYKNNFYNWVASLDMFAAHGATKSKSPHHPPTLQKYFKTQSRRSNPVIVKMKLKDF